MPRTLLTVFALLLCSGLWAEEAGLQALRDRVAAQEQRLAQLQQEFAKLPDEAELERSLATWQRQIEQTLAADFPVGRQQAVTPDASLSQAERLRLLFEPLHRAIERGQTLEAWDAELTAGEGELPRLVTYLRVGRLALFYQSFDARQSAYWHPGRQDWQPLPKPQARELTRAIRMARKQLPPDLLILPITGVQP